MHPQGSSCVIQGFFSHGAVRLQAMGAVPAGGFAHRLPASFRLAGGVPRPMPTAIQRQMEALFKADLSGVRLHVGPQAAELGALAFTTGSNVYFAPGQLDPHSPRGRRLLAHELTHVVQQRAGRVRHPAGNGLAVVRDPALEAEAGRMEVLAARLPPGGGMAQAKPSPVRPRLARQSQPPAGVAHTGVLQPWKIAKSYYDISGGGSATGAKPSFWSETYQTVYQNPQNYRSDAKEPYTRITTYYDQTSYKCALCGGYFPQTLTQLDHNKAWDVHKKEGFADYGGAGTRSKEIAIYNDLDNLHILCATCNNRKRAMEQSVSSLKMNIDFLSGIGKWRSDKHL